MDSAVQGIFERLGRFGRKNLVGRGGRRVSGDTAADPLPDQPRIMVFAPSPELTVTIEGHTGTPDLHLHAGGQGIWQARMISALGVRVSLVAALGGETGRVIGALLADGSLDLHLYQAAARNGGYVHDRREGKRIPVSESPGEPLTRHDLDGLYESALVQGIQAGSAVLSGPTRPETVPATVYRRLAADLAGQGCAVFADLSGKLLDAALEGSISCLRVAHNELIQDGRAKGDEPRHLIAAMRELRTAGAEVVVVSRAHKPALAWLPCGLYEVRAPTLRPVDTRGSGDSMMGALAAFRVTGHSWVDALRAGAAAGALNVTRHGLATGDGESVRVLAKCVELHPLQEDAW